MMSCKYCSKVGAFHPCIRHSICVSKLQLYPSRCSTCQENYARAKAGDPEALRHWRFRLSALKGHRRHRLRLDEVQACQIWGNAGERRCYGDLKDPMNEVEHYEDFDRKGTFNPYIFMSSSSSSSQYDDRLLLSPTEFKPIKIESCMSQAETPINQRGGEESSLHQLQDPKIEIDTSQYSCVDDTPAPLPNTAHSAIPGSSGGSTSELSGLCLVKRDVHCYSVLDQLMKDQTYTDVTITADGHTFYAHKIVLCVASSYFRRVLSDNSPGVRNVVVLRDISHTEMRNLLQFLYTGEATVEASDLPSFMRTAQMLEINSLSDGCLAPPFPPTYASAPAPAAFTSGAAAFGTTAHSRQSYVPTAPQALNVRSNLTNPQFAFSGQPTTSATSTLPFGLAANAMRLQQSNVLLEKPRQALHLQQQLQQHQSPVLTPSLQEHSSNLTVPSRTEMLQIPKIDQIYSEKTRRPGRRRKQPITEPKVQTLPQSSNAQKQQPVQPCGTQQLQHKPVPEPRHVPQQIGHIVPEILAKALLRTPDPRLLKSPLVDTSSSVETPGQHLACDTANGSDGLKLMSSNLASPLSPPPSKSPKLCNGEQFKIKIRSVDSMTATDFDVAESVSSSAGSTTGFAVPESSILTAENNFEDGNQIGTSANVDCVPSVSQIKNAVVKPLRDIESKVLHILTDDTTASRLPCQGDGVISEDVNYANCTASNEKYVAESQSQESSSHSGDLSSRAERYLEEDVPNKRRKIADKNE